MVTFIDVDWLAVNSLPKKDVGPWLISKSKHDSKSGWASSANFLHLSVLKLRLTVFQ